MPVIHAVSARAIMADSTEPFAGGHALRNGRVKASRPYLLRPAT